MNISLEPGVKVERMDYRLRVGIESYTTHRIQHAGVLLDVLNTRLKKEAQCTRLRGYCQCGNKQKECNLNGTNGE